MLKAGYYFGETTELAQNRYQVSRAETAPGTYRKINGNDALVYGLISASQSAGKELLFSGYPITPASSILEGLAAQKHFGVKTVQAEDEIAAIGVALGASFAGDLAVTATSGPGMCLKSEFMGLTAITELPMIICDIQRGGPSTDSPQRPNRVTFCKATLDVMAIYLCQSSRLLHHPTVFLPLGKLHVLHWPTIHR